MQLLLFVAYDIFSYKKKIKLNHAINNFEVFVSLTFISIKNIYNQFYKKPSFK
jgi:hypothetical protein